MAYNPPTYGETGEVYTDNVRNSLEAVRTTADEAKQKANSNDASLTATSQTADEAKEIAEAAKAFVQAPTDGRVATLVQDSTSSTGAALNAAYGGQVNVAAYGAVGDGITDDTPAIQAALDAVPTAGGVVFFPPGTYLVSSTLTVPNRVSLRGCGSGVRGATHLSTIEATTTITYTGADTACLHFAGDAHNIDDLHVTCAAATPTAGSVGLYFANGWGVHMHRTSVSEFYDCVQFKNGKEWTMGDCLIFRPLNYGLLIQNANNPDGGDMGVLGCQFIGAAAAAAVRWESGGGLRFADNKINGDGSGDGYFQYGIDMRVADGVNTGVMLFSDNSIENFTVCGIYAHQLGSTGIVTKVTVTGNEIASFHGGKGVDIGPGYSGVVVEGNTFDANTTSITIRSVNSTVIGENYHSNTTTDGIVAISGSAKNWNIARQNVSGDNITVLSTGSPMSPGAWADAYVDLSREVATVTSTTTYTTVYTTTWPAYSAGLLEFAYSGIAQGVGAFAIKGTRSVSMGGSGAPTVATVGADGGANISTVDLAVTSVATGVVKVEVKLPSSSTSSGLNGAFSLRVIGPVSSIKKGA